MGLRIYAALGAAGSTCSISGRRSRANTRGERARPGSRSKPRRRTAPVPAPSSSGRASMAGASWSGADADLSRSRRRHRRGAARDQVADWRLLGQGRSLSRATCRAAEEERDSLRRRSRRSGSRPGSARPSRRSRTSPPAAGRAWSTRWIGICWATRSRNASPRSGCRPRCSAAVAQTIRSIRESRCAWSRASSGVDATRRHSRPAASSAATGCVPSFVRCGYQRQQLGASRTSG